MTFDEFAFAAGDGLRLSGRLYGTLTPGTLPFVCLPGLTRNARDFHALAEALAGLPDPRPLAAFDYRGRGRSEWSPDAASYSVLQEARDVLVGLEHLGIDRAVFIGTSRGALIIHLLAMMAPEMIASAVLNDAGPRIEAEGLMAIRSYVGLSGPFPDWAAATEHVRTIYAPSFPALSHSDFDRMARATFIETGNGIVADHDPNLARQLALLDLDQPLPELWNAFEALSAVPLLVIRGEHSTLLSRATVDRMQSRHPDLAAVEVAGQGHAPLLESGDLPALIHALAQRATIVPKHRTPD